MPPNGLRTLERARERALGLLGAWPPKSPPARRCVVSQSQAPREQEGQTHYIHCIIEHTVASCCNTAVRTRSTKPHQLSKHGTHFHLVAATAMSASYEFSTAKEAGVTAGQLTELINAAMWVDWNNATFVAVGMAACWWWRAGVCLVLARSHVAPTDVPVFLHVPLLHVRQPTGVLLGPRRCHRCVTC